MTTYKKYIAYGLLLAGMVGGTCFYKEFTRRPDDLYDKPPAERVNVDEIIHSFERDEEMANQKYLGKIILVTGTLAEIINQQDTLINVMLGDNNSMHKVSCLLDKRHLQDINNFKIDQQVYIKGICTGFLIDVELNHCVILKQ